MEMDDPRKWHHAACHCGSIKFVVRLLGEFNTIRRCTCSFCRMRGAIAVAANLQTLSSCKAKGT